MTHRSKRALVFALALIAIATTLAWAGEGTAGEEGFRIAEGDQFSLDVHFFAELDATYGRDEMDYSGQLYGWLGLADAEARFPNDMGFDVRRGRAIFTGKAIAPWLTFRLETELTGDDVSPELLDAYVRVQASDQWALTFGQFKTPFGFFQLTRKWRQLLPQLSPASLYVVPGRDTGAKAEWLSANKKLHAQVAVQNGSGRNSLDTDTDTQVAFRFELTSDKGFSYETPLYSRPDEEQVTLGFSYITNFVPLVDSKTKGLCLPISLSSCQRGPSGDGLEVFFGYRSETVTVLASWQKWIYQDARLVNKGPRPDYFSGIPVPASSMQLRDEDRDVEVLQFEGGAFISPNWQVVGRWVKTEQPDYRLIDPVSSGLGPATLIDTGETNTPVSEDRPPFVELTERLHQWGGGITWFINNKNLKVQAGYLQTELKSFIKDTYVSYVPDLGWRGFDGNLIPIRAKDHKARTGSFFRRDPVMYIVLSWYN